MNREVTLKLTINGVEKEYPYGITYGEIAKEYEKDAIGGIAVALHGDNIRELFLEVCRNGRVDFLDFSTPVGHATYMRTAVLLFVKAVYDVIGLNHVGKLKLEFSMNTGFFFSYESDSSVSKDLVKQITAKMQQMVDERTPIRKDNFPLSEAMAIFENQNMPDKVKTCRFRKGRDINLYEVEGYFDYFYGTMLPHMGLVQWFEVIPIKGGFILNIPTQAEPTVLPKFKPLPQIFNTMMAANEMIVTNTSSAKIREWVNDSNVSGRILMSIIDDMLDLSRIEAGRLNILDQPWDTRRLFDETARAWKTQADKEGLYLEHEIDDGVPAYLSGDEDIIRKITNNLLSNAVKYTKVGGITLSVRWDGELEITVRDTGVGIAPEYIKEIFKPFDRGVQELYRETSGSGLGLAIVKELVDAVGGTIDCNSALDVGTAFIVRLPQKEYSAKKDAASSHEDGSDNASTKRRKKQFVAPDARILVVDDNALNRKVIEGFLEPALIQIDDVESGSEALEMIDIKTYDLVLMDLRMPGMDGTETLRKIREDYPDFDTPVVVLTADIMNDVKEKLLKQGFADFIPKPVNSSSLYDAIARLIPDKVVMLETDSEDGLTLAEIEEYQDRLIPYGINLKLALESNAGNTAEFLTRAELFDEYADDNIAGLKKTGEDYYLQVHSIKSIARGVGAYLLAQLSETAELRHDDDFAKDITPVLLDEYERVRAGLNRFREEVGQTV